MMNGNERIGVLVTHGTDTMAWTLAYLSYHLHNRGFNVALTGAMRPIDVALTPTDGYDNLIAAVEHLAHLRGPEVFCSFNRGRKLYIGSVVKVDCWDDDAFDGVERASKEAGGWARRAGTEWSESKRLNRLILVPSGGTIESEEQDSLWTVGGAVVEPFLARQFAGKFALEPAYPKTRIDSSDAVPDFWRAIGELIAEKSRQFGASCVHDGTLAEDVRVVYCDPFKTAEDYESEFDGASGVILAGLGAGNVNQDRWYESAKGSVRHSPLPAIKKAASGSGSAYVPVILTTQVPSGVPDFVYENGWVAMHTNRMVAEVTAEDSKAEGDALALPAGSFGLARAQVKLATILGHKERLEEMAREWTLPGKSVQERYRMLVDGLFLSGMGFSGAKRHRQIEIVRDVEFPAEDLLVNRSVEDAAERLMAMQGVAESKIRVFHEAEELYESGGSRSPAVGDAPLGRRRVAVLKPDRSVGRNAWGMQVDASTYASAFFRKAFGWSVDVAEVSSWRAPAEEAQEAARLAEHLRGYDVLVGEGGNPSVYEPSSFGAHSRSFWIEVFEQLIRLRAREPGSAPGIFVCLSHQLAADAVASLLGKIVAAEAELSRALEPSSGAKRFWNETVQPALHHVEWAREDLPGSSVVRSLGLPRSEHGVVRLVPYVASNDLGVPDLERRELVEAHAQIAEAHSGFVEDLFSVESLELAMMHGDEVDELRVLQMNLVLTHLARLARVIRRDESLPRSDAVARVLELPVGIEITSASVPEDTPGARDAATVTEVASTAYYYRRPDGGIYRDLTFQFHPELVGVDVFRAEPGHAESVDIRMDNDGHKLLLNAVMRLLGPAG